MHQTCQNQFKVRLQRDSDRLTRMLANLASQQLKKSSEIVSQGKTMISENAPRAISWMNISMKEAANIVRQLHHQKDVDLLKRLS